MYPYQHFIILGDRFGYLFELENIRWSVFCPNNCFHEAPLNDHNQPTDIPLRFI